MDPLKVLKIGRLVDMEVINEVYNGELFPTKIADMDEEFIYVHLPISEKQYVTARSGDIVKLNVKMEDGIYSSRCKVIYRKLEPYAHIKVTLPKKVNKEQRREFFRMPVNIVVNYAKEGDEKKKTAVSIDLSGGGFCFISRNKLGKNEILIFDFQLTNGKKYNHVKGLVKWKIEKLEKQYEYGIEFINLERREREEIISYLFELQRNRRIVD
jgi:c-di-GMP-binding flagellar brake protein YcgR